MVGTWSTIAKLRRLVDIPLLMALSGSSYGSITPGSIREDAGVADDSLSSFVVHLCSNRKIPVALVEASVLIE